MHILITDSGVGGLSVCAYAEKWLREHGSAEPVQLTYVNASRENDFGYNSMGSRQEKLDHFDRFLHIVTDRFAPDSIYIACNTLSVLLHDTGFAQAARRPVRGIVESGVTRLLTDLRQSPESTVMIFATPTTIDEGSYPKLLSAAGVSGARIVSQSCPGLADTISEDREGWTAKRQIGHFVRAALDQLQRPATSSLVYLACTHYGYRKELFAAAFAEAGAPAQILNPNEFAVDDVLGPSLVATAGHGDDVKRRAIPVEFVTRYRIPDTALETITFFLNEVSPTTVHAFQNYSYEPELF